MPKTNKDYKIKLLYLYEILKHTDENHRLTTKQIIAELAKHNISCDRKILYDDIQTLNDNGFEILSNRAQQMEYYVESPALDDYELRILLDAVQASHFITDKKTKELSAKIVGLVGPNKNDFIEKNITCFNERKCSNEKIFYSIDEITRAIQESKKIQFRYFDLDLNGNRKFHKDGEFYVENPIDLIINDGMYYLLVYNEKYDDLTPYRVDRMDKVEMTSTPAIKKKVKEAKEFRNKTFSMYSGNDTRVTLSFNKKYTNQVLDKLGYNLRCEAESDDAYTISVNVDVSDTFFAWCFTFGENMQIKAPEDVVQKYREKLAKTLNSLPRF